MARLWKTRNLNVKMPVSFHLLIGVSSIALSALVAVSFAASAVHADARLPELFPNAHLSPSAVAAPPFAIAPQLAPDSQWADPSPDLAAWYRGIASWYGKGFNGQLTASGTPFDMYAMTAATSEFQHKLPLGSTVRVTNRHNQRSVVVRINDRGPLPNGRILDLSYGAASRLAMIHPGLADVQLHVLSWGSDRDR